MPWERSQGPSDNIRVWNESKGHYEHYKLDKLTRTKREAQARAEYKRSKIGGGHKVRVKYWSNTIGERYWCVYVGPKRK